ncbi:hypothetical protein LBYZC6_29860 [Lacrimispora brassicae]
MWLSYIQLEQICKQRYDYLCLQIVLATTRYSEIQEAYLYIVVMKSLEKLFELMAQIPLTRLYGHVILKTRCETERKGNQLKQIE